MKGSSSIFDVILHEPQQKPCANANGSNTVRQMVKANRVPHRNNSGMSFTIARTRQPQHTVYIARMLAIVHSMIEI